MSMLTAMPMRINAIFTVAPVAFIVTDTISARSLTAICQKSGTIDRVQVLKRTTAGNGATLNARIETVFQSIPTGTLVAAGADGSVALDATTGVKTITLATPLTVAQGDIISPLIWCSNATGTPSLGQNIFSPCSLPALSAGLPGLRSNATFSVGSAANWTNHTPNVYAVWAALYDDGEPLAGSCVVDDIALGTNVVPTSGANSYSGLKFTADGNCDLVFVEWCGRTDGSVRWELYDSSNTLLGTTNTLASQTLNTTPANTSVALFTSPVALTGGQSYRLIERSVSGANNSQTTMKMSDATMLAALFGAWVRTTSADGVTWTDDTTGICPGIIPFITPTGSGGGGSSTQNPFRSRAFGG